LLVAAREAKAWIIERSLAPFDRVEHAVNRY
jgi:hypothetical protein